MGTFGVNGEESRGDTHGVPANDNEEESGEIRRQKMGDAGGRSCTRGSRKPVDKYLHRETTGNRGAVSGATYLILGVCKGYMVRRRGAQEGDVVAPRGDRKKTSVHPDRIAEI